METMRKEARPPTALRLMDALVWVAMAGLAVLTVVIAFFMIGKGLFGGGTMYSQGYTGDVIIEHVQPSGDTMRVDLTQDFDPISEAGVRFLSADVRVKVEGTGPRLVLVVAMIADLALAWFALINVQRLTRSSMRGDVFTKDNATRIARLGWTAIAFPFVVWWLGRSVFQSVYSDDQVGVTGFLVRDGVHRWETWVLVGLLLHILARAFRWGVELQELEATTI